jgi:hypothetical protein
MQLIFAIAKGTPRQVSTKYGQKTVIDATGNNGEEITIWRGGDDQSPALKSIANGSRITVGLDSKGKYSLIEAPADRVAQAAKPISPELVEVSRPMGFAVAPSPVSLPFEAEQGLRAQMAAAVAPPVADGMAERGRSAEIADYINRLGKLYGHCYGVAAQQLESTALATPEVKDVATTIFIHTLRHFNL